MIGCCFAVVALFSGFSECKFCVMVILCQRETEGEKDYVGHWSNSKER
jgi:hypothetical protein